MFQKFTGFLWKVVTTGGLLLVALAASIMFLGPFGIVFAIIGGLALLAYRLWFGRSRKVKRTTRTTTGRTTNTDAEDITIYRHPAGRHIVLAVMWTAFVLAGITGIWRMSSALPDPTAKPTTRRVLPVPQPLPVGLQPAQKVESIRFPLLGETKLSEEMLNTSKWPARTRFDFEGPPTAEGWLEDGTHLPIAADFGKRYLKVRFSGPAGREVVVKVYPP